MVKGKDDLPEISDVPEKHQTLDQIVALFNSDIFEANDVMWITYHIGFSFSKIQLGEVEGYAAGVKNILQKSFERAAVADVVSIYKKLGDKHRVNLDQQMQDGAIYMLKRGWVTQVLSLMDQLRDEVDFQSNPALKEALQEGVILAFENNDVESVPRIINELAENGERSVIWAAACQKTFPQFVEYLNSDNKESTLILPNINFFVSEKGEASKDMMIKFQSLIAYSNIYIKSEFNKKLSEYGSYVNLDNWKDKVSEKQVLLVIRWLLDKAKEVKRKIESFVSQQVLEVFEPELVEYKRLLLKLLKGAL